MSTPDSGAPRTAAAREAGKEAAQGAKAWSMADLPIARHQVCVPGNHQPLSPPCSIVARTHVVKTARL